ncbi:MAG TPA: ATP-binding protein [Xanthomonadaceae bacterium]|nr:ATP-binding protein [Xanthomonadaceae bacterium]
MRWRRSLSLQARQLLAASLGLIAFLGLTGYALDRAFVEVARNNVRERLKSYAYAYLGGIEFQYRSGELIPPELPPDPRFNRPGSGLYAVVVGDTVEWRSMSTLGRTLPEDVTLPLNSERFEGPLETGESRFYRYAFGTEWERDQIPFTISVVETASMLERQVAVFRRALWVYLGAGALLLLGLQVLVLRWSLQPLRRVVRDMVRVEEGASERLTGRYPRELALLTDAINAFVESERDHLRRYRNTLGDLAHSLKTPLAVLRSRLETGADDATLREELHAQVDRMDQIVAYQLSRAATSGHRTFSAPLAIAEHAENIVRSLEKVYVDKNVLCEFDIDPISRFYGEPGDLMELLGNLVENAFKWCNHRVLLSARAMTIAPNRRSGLLLMVEDDGPGIPDDKVEHVLQRGVRGDERVRGHGIGLAIVQDIVRAYHGELAVERSDELGGARFVVRFSPAI